MLKSPTGIEIGKSTDSRIWAIKTIHTGIFRAKFRAPAAYHKLAISVESHTHTHTERERERESYETYYL